MRQLPEFPPNFEELKKHFDVGPGKSVVFCYGDAIYNPYNLTLRDDLVYHESIHAAQQGADPALWWDRYIADTEFRISQEAEAYGKQAWYIRVRKGEKALERVIEAFAGFLSSPVYGSIISFEDARHRIREMARP